MRICELALRLQQCEQQWHSVRPSVAISGNQWHSEAIRDHERQASALNSTCSSVNSSPPGQYSSTCEMMRAAIQGGHQVQSEAIIETVQPLRALEARNQLVISS